VLGIPGATTTEERLAGYRRALEEAGLAYDEALIAWGGYRVEGGRRATAELLSLPEPPDAVFSTNNLMTVGVLQELFRRGIRIPDQVAVVGFDDLEWAEFINPQITVVSQRPYEIGHQAVLMLLRQFANKERSPAQELRVPVDLRVRGSS